MRTNRASLWLALISLSAETPSAFVPDTLRRQKLLGGCRTTNSNSQLFELSDSWRIPGKPDWHPDHRLNEHNIDLTPLPRLKDEQEMPREMARRNVKPLAEDNGDDIDDGTKIEAEQLECERTVEQPTLAAALEGDTRLNDLMEEAMMIAEEVNMRVEEEEALIRAFADFDPDMRRESISLITDPESILGGQARSNRVVSDAGSVDSTIPHPAETTNEEAYGEMMGLSPEEVEEEKAQIRVEAFAARILTNGDYEVYRVTAT